jgi:transcriptional regulator with XRE-family HTH domain
MSLGSWLVNFKNRLKKLRARTGLTQEQLAAKVRTVDGRPLSVGTLRGWEIGRRMPSAHAISPLARALGVSDGVLLGSEPMPPDPPEPHPATQPPHPQRGPKKAAGTRRR